MKRFERLCTWLSCCALALLAMPGIAFAAKKAAKNVVNVADTRIVHEGILHWWAQLYNESHLYFAILTIIIIPVTGCIFGMLADVVMNHIGIDLKHRELSE
ncbi:MAG: hypothetical protein K6F46_00740 [Desulfovibrio sp.]|nr:hypothetical protein [Desulfovibrio sp.]